MSKHTPGPWAVRPLDDHSRFVAVMPAAGGPNICNVYAPATHTDAEQDANARLIAAAPDLLAACEALVEFFDSVRPGGPVLQSDPDIQVIRAAIARAKGGWLMSGREANTTERPPAVPMITAADLARVQPLHVDGRGGMRCNLRWKISGPPAPDGFVPARVRQWRYIGRGCDFPVEIERRHGENHAVVSAVLAMNLHYACNDIVPLTALVGMDRDLVAPAGEGGR